MQSTSTSTLAYNWFSIECLGLIIKGKPVPMAILNNFNTSNTPKGGSWMQIHTCTLVCFLNEGLKGYSENPRLQADKTNAHDSAMIFHGVEEHVVNLM